MKIVCVKTLLVHVPGVKTPFCKGGNQSATLKAFVLFQTPEATHVHWAFVVTHWASTRALTMWRHHKHEIEYLSAIRVGDLEKGWIKLKRPLTHRRIKQMTGFGFTATIQAPRTNDIHQRGQQNPVARGKRPHSFRMIKSSQSSKPTWETAVTTLYNAAHNRQLADRKDRRVSRSSKRRRVSWKDHQKSDDDEKEDTTIRGEAPYKGPFNGKKLVPQTFGSKSEPATWCDQDGKRDILEERVDRQ